MYVNKVNTFLSPKWTKAKKLGLYFLPQKWVKVSIKFVTFTSKDFLLVLSLDYKQFFESDDHFLRGAN